MGRKYALNSKTLDIKNWFPRELYPKTLDIQKLVPQGVVPESNTVARHDPLSSTPSECGAPISNVAIPPSLLKMKRYSFERSVHTDKQTPQSSACGSSSSGRAPGSNDAVDARAEAGPVPKASKYWAKLLPRPHVEEEMLRSYLGLFSLDVCDEESEDDSSIDGEFAQAQGSWVADFVLAFLRCSELKGYVRGLVG